MGSLFIKKASDYSNNAISPLLVFLFDNAKDLFQGEPLSS